APEERLSARNAAVHTGVLGVPVLARERTLGALASGHLVLLLAEQLAPLLLGAFHLSRHPSILGPGRAPVSRRKSPALASSAWAAAASGEPASRSAGCVPSSDRTTRRSPRASARFPRPGRSACGGPAPHAPSAWPGGPVSLLRTACAAANRARRRTRR